MRRSTELFLERGWAIAITEGFGVRLISSISLSRSRYANFRRNFFPNSKLELQAAANGMAITAIVSKLPPDRRLTS